VWVFQDFLDTSLLLLNVEFKIVKVLKYFVKYQNILRNMMIDQARLIGSDSARDFYPIISDNAWNKISSLTRSGQQLSWRMNLRNWKNWQANITTLELAPWADLQPWLKDYRSRDGRSSRMHSARYCTLLCMSVNVLNNVREDRIVCRPYVETRSSVIDRSDRIAVKILASQ